MALKDIQKDSRLYSGWNRYKVWGMEIYPLETAIVGGMVGSRLGGFVAGPVGMVVGGFVGGLGGGVLGDYYKESMKNEIPTDKEKEVRLLYREVKK